MTDQNSNPFVLPGMGQGGSDTAGNPLLASMEMMRQAWAGLAGPGGLAQSLPMTPPMNLPDLERRIAELRSVESWLRMNLSMLSSTIQGMEVQRSTIATLRSFVDTLGSQARDPAAWGDASPLEVALGLKPAPGGASRPDSTRSRPAGTGEAGTSPRQDAARDRVAGGADTDAPDEPAQSGSGGISGQGPGSATGASPEGAASGQAAGASAGSADAISQAAQSASEAWWGMLQQQFNQLAAATAATMPGGQPQGGTAAASSAAGAGASGGSAGRARRSSGAQAAHGDAGAGHASAGHTPAGKSAAANKAAGKSAADNTAPRKAAPRKAASRKTAARKNKIQSGSDRS
jgi:hypothetical protein